MDSTRVRSNIPDPGPPRKPPPALQHQASAADFHGVSVTKSYPELHGAASMPSFGAYDTYNGTQVDNDMLLQDPLLNDPLLQSFDPLQSLELQTPELDPLSPTFFDLQTAQTPELSNSVGSAGSPTRQQMPPGVEGLGIAESISRWQVPSPERRAKVATRGVTKKPSKSTLKQRRSRASLNEETSASSNAYNGTCTSPPASPLRPQRQQQHQQEKEEKQRQQQQQQQQHERQQLPPPIQQSQRTQQYQQQSRPQTQHQPQLHPQLHPQLQPQLQPVPTTPALKQRNRLVSPAMRSPLRTGMKSRLPAAAAATALYGNPSTQPVTSQPRGMAAAAAAAAASASSLQPPVTPLTDKLSNRVSPTTLVVSSKGGHVGSGNQLSTSSPTPAARMQSTSKLVAHASDSSPAKGMWQQAPRPPISLAELHPPAISPRKSASALSLRGDSRRKNPKIIPEMSSSLNQFQVELRPRRSVQNTRTQASNISSKGSNSAPVNYMPSATATPISAPAALRQTTSIHGGHTNGNMHNKHTQSMPIMPQNIPQSIPQSVPHSVPQNIQGISHSIPQNMPQSMPECMPQSIPQDLSGYETLDLDDGLDYSMLMYDTSQSFFEPERSSSAIPPMPNNSLNGVTSPAPPANNSASFLEHSKVQPQGEPPQHVWASRPQPQKRRQSINKKRAEQVPVAVAPTTAQAPPPPPVIHAMHQPMHQPMPQYPVQQHQQHQQQQMQPNQSIPQQHLMQQQTLQYPQSVPQPHYTQQQALQQSQSIEQPQVSRPPLQRTQSQPASQQEQPQMQHQHPIINGNQDQSDDFMSEFLNDWEWDFMDALETI